MSKFTIITKGIAASYIKDDVWKLLFPFNECHQVRLQLGSTEAANNTDTGNDGGIPLGQKGVNIEITVSDPQSKTAEGANYQDFMDLTCKGAHEALTTKSQLADMNAVLMTIPYAEFSVLDYLDRGYRFVDQDGEALSSSYQKIGNSGKAEIVGGELTIRVTGLAGGSFSVVFSEDATIVFDNDCYEQTLSKKGDLEMLYDILSDAGQNSIKFTLEAEPKKAVAGSNGVSASVSTVAGGMSAELSASATNPETPVMRNPALFGGEEGLPCNKYRISKPGDLP